MVTRLLACAKGHKWQLLMVIALSKQFGLNPFLSGQMLSCMIPVKVFENWFCFSKVAWWLNDDVMDAMKSLDK